MLSDSYQSSLLLLTLRRPARDSRQMRGTDCDEAPVSKLSSFGEPKDASTKIDVHPASLLFRRCWSGGLRFYQASCDMTIARALVPKFCGTAGVLLNLWHFLDCVTCFRTADAQ